MMKRMFLRFMGSRRSIVNIYAIVLALRMQAPSQRGKAHMRQ
jgi:hypothetical protein